eukprot:GSChrysophyteH1.ASY1.ANO1.702.1 assembled CDS
MEKTKPWVLVNGAGRIGRMLMRQGFFNDNIKIVAVNDPGFSSAEELAYSLCHDSVHGKFSGKIVASKDNNCIVVKADSNTNGYVEIIQVFHFTDPEKIPHSDIGTDYVIECSGNALSAHKHRVKKVIMSHPPAQGENIPVLVPGVNLDDYIIDSPIVSMASCTTNCLAPLALVLDTSFGIKKGLFTTVHSITASQPAVDTHGKKNLRMGRSCVENIIPSTSGATRSLEYNPCTLESLEAAVQSAAQSTAMRGVIGITSDQLVSSDFLGDTRSCIVDLNASLLLDNNFIKVVAWYDNEVAYAAKLIDLAIFMSEKDTSVANSSPESET